MKVQNITEETAHRIWNILVEHAGVHDWQFSSRDSFARIASEGKWTEFRIGGPLGFGGKVWNNDGRFYVNCYLEDGGAEQEKIIEVTNKALDDLFEEVYGEQTLPDSFSDSSPKSVIG